MNSATLGAEVTSLRNRIAQAIADAVGAEEVRVRPILFLDTGDGNTDVSITGVTNHSVLLETNVSDGEEEMEFRDLTLEMLVSVLSGVEMELLKQG